MDTQQNVHLTEPVRQHWTDYLVRFLSEDGAGSAENIRAVERFTYANDAGQVRSVERATGHASYGPVHTTRISTAPDAHLTITDAQRVANNEIEAEGLAAIAQQHLEGLVAHRANYHPLLFHATLGDDTRTHSLGNYFPNGGFPRTYETFKVIIGEGLDALDRRSLDELSTTWRPQTTVLSEQNSQNNNPNT